MASSRIHHATSLGAVTWFLLVVCALISGARASAGAGVNGQHRHDMSQSFTAAVVDYWSSSHVSDHVQRPDSNFLCRALGRCLLQLAPAPSYTATSSPAGYPPPAPPLSLPTLPTPDPSLRSPPPPPSPTDPSYLSPPSSSSADIYGGSGAGISVSKPPPTGNIAAKIGLSAGVGVTGFILLVLGLLYYFKPDVFMCCKTCVRVQIFHHNGGKN